MRDLGVLRLDAQGSAWFELVDQINEQLLALRLDGRPIDFGLLANGYCPVDIDTFAMDNGDSAKEGVGRTYAGVDGYCPLAAYLGTQGYCLQLALRPGTQHSACESQYNLEHVLPLAARLSSAPLLLRADSGFCSKDLMLAVHSHASALGRTVDYLIKWNPRSTPVQAWAQAKCADEATVWCLLREGQARLRVAGGCRTGPGRGRSAHRGPAHLPPDRAHHRQARDKQGNHLLLPQYTLEGWSTSLPQSITPAQIIELYCQHGTHEQFHSEFKTDMGLERLPSGKFDTNYLVCQMACVAHSPCGPAGCSVWASTIRATRPLRAITPNCGRHRRATWRSAVP